MTERDPQEAPKDEAETGPDKAADPKDAAATVAEAAEASPPSEPATVAEAPDPSPESPPSAESPEPDSDAPAEQAPEGQASEQEADGEVAKDQAAEPDQAQAVASEPSATAPPAEVDKAIKKVSAFKGKAPAERGKDGSIYDRLKARRAEEKKERMATTSVWVRRMVMLAIAGMLVYYFFGPAIKTRFYLSLTHTNDPNWFYWAVDKLAEREAKVAVPAFVEALKTSDTNRKFVYVHLIEELAGPEHREALLKLARRRDAKVRGAAFYSFYYLVENEWLRSPEWYALMRETLLDDLDRNCRVFVAMTLGKLDKIDEETVKALSKALEDRAPSVRRHSLLALSRLRDPALQDTFLAALRDRVPEVRLAAAIALARIGDGKAISALTEHYEYGQPNDRLRVVEALSELQKPGATRFLLRAVKDPEEQVAVLAIKGLRERQGQGIDGALVSVLDSSIASVRITAVQLIGERQVKDAVPRLIKNLGNFEGRNELVALDEALEKLTKAKGIPAPGSDEKTWERTVEAWRQWYKEQRQG